MEEIFSDGEKLELLDLRQIELIEKANTRIAADLSQWKKNTQSRALLEREIDRTKSLSDNEIASLGPNDSNGEPFTRTKLFEAIEERGKSLETERMRLIVAMKSVVWNASNALKNDHSRRKEIQSPIEEKEEMEEVNNG